MPSTVRRASTGFSAAALAAGLLLAVPGPASAESTAAPAEIASVTTSTSSAAAAALPSIKLLPGQCIPGPLRDQYHTYRYTTTQYGTRYYRYYQTNNPGVEGSASCPVDQYKYYQNGTLNGALCTVAGATVALGSLLRGARVIKILWQGLKGCAAVTG